MAIAGLSFSAALPTYQSFGTNGTLFGNSTIAAKGDVAINTNGGPAASGKATVLTSDLSANGLNYSPLSAIVNGNQVTIYYNLTGNNVASAATTQTALQTLQSGDQAAALAGGFYGKGLTITPEGSQTNGNVKTTEYEISLNGPANNTFGTVNHQTGYSVSNSADGSSLSLEGISSLGTGLKATFQLSDGPPSTSTQPPISISDPSNNTKSLPQSLQGITTLGDLLANANGLINKGGTSSTTVLASVLTPTTKSSPNSPINIGDFINTSADAFPTSAPQQQTTNNFSNSFDNQKSTNAFDTTFNASNTATQNNFVTPPIGNAAMSAYSAFSNVGASTIRGGGLNVVA